MVRAKKKISAFDGLEQDSLQQTPALKRQRGVVNVVDDPTQGRGPGDSMATTEGKSCSPSHDPSFKAPTSVSSKPQEPFLVDSEDSDVEVKGDEEIDLEEQDCKAHHVERAEEEDTEKKWPSFEAEFERMLEEEEENREAEGVAPVEPVGCTEDAEEDTAQKWPSLEAEFERLLEEEEENREAEGVAPVEPVGRTEDAEEDTAKKRPSLEAEFERMLEEEEENKEAEGVAPVEPVGLTEDAEENEATAEKDPRAESSERLIYAEEAPAAEKEMEVPKRRPRWKAGSLEEEEKNEERITVLSSSSRRCSKTSSTPRGILTHPKKASRRREEPEEPPEGREEEGGSDKQDETEAVTLSDDDPLLTSASMARGVGRETSLWSKDDFAYVRRVIRRGQGRSIKTGEDVTAFLAIELSKLPIEALKIPPFLISKQDLQSRSLHELGQLLQILYPMQNDESELEALCIRIEEEVNAKLLTAISSSLCSVGIKAGVHDLKEPYSEHLMALFRPISRFIKPSELEPTLVKIVVDFSETLEDRMSAQTFLKLLTTIGATEKAFPSRQPLDIHVTKDIYPFWKTMMKTMIQEGRR